MQVAFRRGPGAVEPVEFGDDILLCPSFREDRNGRYEACQRVLVRWLEFIRVPKVEYGREPNFVGQPRTVVRGHQFQRPGAVDRTGTNVVAAAKWIGSEFAEIVDALGFVSGRCSHGRSVAQRRYPCLMSAHASRAARYSTGAAAAKLPPMTEPHTFRVNRPNVVDETLDGEALIVNLGTGVYYSIAGTGEVIWRMLSEGTPPTAVAANLQRIFDVSPTEAASAVGLFVEQLVAEELLIASHGELVDAETSTPAGPSDGLRAPFVAPELKRYADMQDLLLLDPVHDVDEKGWPNALAAPLPGTERRG